MPRGVYPRKKKAGNDQPKRPRKPAGVPKLLEQLRAERTHYEDKVVALGTAIEALEALDA